MSTQQFNSCARILAAGLLAIFCAAAVAAQTTQFTYQGLLNDGGSPATGAYDLQFKLYDALMGGAQVGSTVTVEDVTVTSGLFKATLDFGAAAFPGANRWLEIGVRPGASMGAFTTLSPRQPLTSTPYALRSLNAATAALADGLSVACVNCVASSQINTVQGSQVTGSIAGSQIAGAIPVASVPSGSANYVQNTTTQQSSANFNISGSGTAGGTLSGNLVNSATQYNLGGNRVLSVAGTGNLFAGIGTGTNNTTGSDNVFIGTSAGALNTTGTSNAFLGRNAGVLNAGGFNNSFFGASAGAANTSGGENSFLGRSAGSGNTTGSSNVFAGYLAGSLNTIGFSNTLLGATANVSLNNLSFATAVGSGAVVSASNTLVLGRNLDTVQIPGSLTVTGTVNTAAQYHLGGNRILSAPGTANLFAGVNAGTANTGVDNSFFGASAGTANSTGFNNSFFGAIAGRDNTTGQGNSFFGAFAGHDNTTGQYNSIFGAEAGHFGTTGNYNAFFGAFTGQNTSTGFGNAFFGASAGLSNTTGDSNTFIGQAAGSTNTAGFSNTLIGANADLGAANLFFATAIGANAVVSTSNTIVLGRASETVRVPGYLVVGTLAAAANNHVCINGSAQLAACASSRRYKRDIAPLAAGLNLINGLRPVTFHWKETGEPDLGLIAEEVAVVEPLLVTHNATGEIQGVKYDQLSVVLVNAIQQQQAQIQQQQRQNANLQQQLEQQRAEIEELKSLVCRSRARAAACQTEQSSASQLSSSAGQSKRKSVRESGGTPHEIH